MCTSVYMDHKSPLPLPYPLLPSPALPLPLSLSLSAGMSFTRLTRTGSRRWQPNTSLDVWSSQGAHHSQHETTLYHFVIGPLLLPLLPPLLLSSHLSSSSFSPSPPPLFSLLLAPLTPTSTGFFAGTTIEPIVLMISPGIRTPRAPSLTTLDSPSPSLTTTGEQTAGGEHDGH